MSESAIQLGVRPDGIAVLTVDQPGSRANILTRALWNELHSAFVKLGSETSLRGLIVESGKPSIFIAGADLKYLGRVPAPGDPGVKELMDFGLATLALLAELPYPTCAIIDGAALGGGLEVALACDYRLVGTNPKVELGLPEVTLGLIPGWGGTQRLPRIINVSTAADMVMTGSSVSGSEALRMGLVDGIIGKQTPEALFASGKHLQRRIAKNSPVPESARSTFTLHQPDPAVRAGLPVIAFGTSLPLDEAVKLETAAFVGLAGSDDSRRRIAEFFEKRRG